MTWGTATKKPAKTVSTKASDKKKKTEIYARDESQFSTEPYLVKGWLKKR